MQCRVWGSLMVAAAVAVMVNGGAAREKRQTRQCSAHESCTFLSRCGYLQNLVSSRAPGWQQRIKDAICGPAQGIDHRVCCPDGSGSTPTATPTTNGEDLLPKGLNCGVHGRFRVVFGENAPINAYPWMVLLGYGDPNNPAWKCGGALINDRYILTAAHCVHSDFTVPAGHGPLVKVRLGEHNTATTRDCLPPSFTECNPEPQDFTIASTVFHPQFNKRAPVSDDIALIRINGKATLGDSVTPVCLPEAGLDVETFLGARDVVVAGWGATETATSSDILQVAKIPFVSKALCEPEYPGELVNEQVCFGGRGTVDSCYGDSGGPVFQVSTNFPNYVALGIVSRGQSSCGIPGVPAVYTNVAFYRQWIVQNIKP